MVKKVAKKRSRKTSLKSQLQLLNNWSLFFGSFLLVEALVIGLLTKSTTVPITTSFLTKDSLTSAAVGQDILAPATHHLIDIKIACLVIASLVVAAAFFLIQATWLRKNYEAKLKNGRNTFYWLMSIASSGVIAVTVALLNGIYDVSTLIGIFAFIEIFGLFMLLLESRQELKMHPRLVGKLALAAITTPVIIILVYLLGAKIYGTSLPAYVYFLDLLLAVILISQTAVMLSANQAKGKWGSNVFVAKAYLVLGFVGTSILAWVVFFGALR